MFTRASYLLLALASILAVPSVPGQPAPRVFYVDQSATGADNGTSWADAKTSLQEALLLASAGGEIWVAAGVYTPDVGFQQTIGDKNARFEPASRVSLFGGFSGNESTREERNWIANETILSGDLSGNDSIPFNPFDPSREDNSENVVYIENDPSLPHPSIDGFTIEGGHSTYLEFGGGIYIFRKSHVFLRNLILRSNFATLCGGAIGSLGSIDIRDSQIVDNHAGTRVICPGGDGGGIYHWSFQSEIALLPIPRIENVLFERNRTFGRGGGLASGGGKIHVINCQFVGNEAAEGGAVFLDDTKGNTAIYANSTFVGNISTEDGGGAFGSNFADALIVNSVFSGNRVFENASFSSGGAFSLESSNLNLVNSSVTNNVAVRAGALFSELSSLRITNSIIWNNPTQDGEEIDTFEPSPSSIKYSVISFAPPEGFETEAVLFGDPGFARPLGQDGISGTLDDDLRLLGSSIAIDAGNNELIPVDVVDLDSDGNTDEAVPIDLDGFLRIASPGQDAPSVDIGAYEFGSVPVGVEPTVFDVPPGMDSCPITHLYPNPTQGIIHIGVKGGLRGMSDLLLFDSLGRMVMEAKLGDSFPDTLFDKAIDLSSLNPGVYWIALRTADSRHSCYRKVILLN